MVPVFEGDPSTSVSDPDLHDYALDLPPGYGSVSSCLPISAETKIFYDHMTDQISKKL